MVFRVIAGLMAGLVLAGQGAAPVPRFADPERVGKLMGAMGEVDRLFRSYAAGQKIPGMVWGVVIDGKLVHIGTHGVQDRGTQAPVGADTVFRIASMTKSFTALAVLQLRDEGRLSLEDPVSRWIPAFGRMALPTKDSAPIRVRQLLSHAAGFPEDNPWGDQQLGVSDAQVDEWLRAGIPFSTAPGTRYEYSNYAFGLLGRIIAAASGRPYEAYMKAEILDKLGMRASTFEAGEVGAGKRATGYRLRPDGSYGEEPPLPHGAFGAMGGLLTTANDLGKYVAFHLSAWPPRDEPEAGPVRRASVREMSQLWTPANLTAEMAGGTARVTQSGYGYGLRIAADCRFGHIVSHGGGLPGFGSYMSWLPEYGVGMFAMATLTYSGPSRPMSAAFDAMRATGGLERREAVAAEALVAARERIWKLWNGWDEAEAGRMAAMNLFLDAPVEQRKAEMARLSGEVGGCRTAGPVRAENWLRGQFNMQCEKGTVGVFFTLAPTKPPLVQHLEFRRLQNEKIRMGAPTGAPAGVACPE